MTTLFYKLVSLKNFSLYLNQNKELLSDLKDPSAIISNLNDTIARDNHVPDFNYSIILYQFYLLVAGTYIPFSVLQPLTITAKLRLNQRPESDKDKFSIPKIDLHFDLKSLVLSLQQRQYQDILLFLEAQERFNLAGKYLKYRPKNIFSYRGNYKKWYNFCDNQSIY